MVRRPDLAGTFYPADKQTLLEELERCTQPDLPKKPCIGAIVPHAGYIYSGAIAGELLSQVTITPTVIILGPNHRGPFVPLAFSPDETWRTPIGDVEIDKTLQAAIEEQHPVIQYNEAAHANENSIEVQVPFLQYLRPDVKIVPIVIAEHRYDPLAELGAAIAECVRGKDVLILASSDMTHFEDAKTAKRHDDMAIKHVLALDPISLHRTVIDNNISMCGFAPSVAMLVAAKELGAGNAELVRYGHSGAVTGDNSRVVAYAAMRVY